MIFNKNKNKKGIFTKIDKIITGLIIGSALTGMLYTVKKRKTIKHKFYKIYRYLFSKFGLTLVYILKIFSKKDK